MNPHCSSADYVTCELSKREKSTGKRRIPERHMLQCLAIPDHLHMALKLQLELSGMQCSVTHIIEQGDAL
jgi:hypothetical protein